jgi:hypothetical protein
MKEQGTEKRKSPVITTVRKNETKMDFLDISDVSTRRIAMGGREVFKIQRKLYLVPGTAESKRRSAGGGGDI